MTKPGNQNEPLSMPALVTWVWIAATFVLFFVQFSMVFYRANESAIQALLP